ncbi:MAG: hypothetical protein WGN25_12230 [Candidatus Electrothrix sp. GW3-4]|uniref:hypothetical protein n=1 Tax=Candidatus Electrothrix sp. GW3-4 TaxID=3126740 RepID=UPI0030CF131F
MKQTRYRIGVLSLLLSCLSLMLAILPSCMITQKIKEIETEGRVDHAAVSLEIEGVNIKFAPLKDPEAKNILIKFSESERKIKSLQRLSVFFTAAMVLLAIAAIGAAIYSLDKEHGKEICIGSIITTVVALSWQYIGAGVSAGAAVLVFIMLVASFS